MHTILTICRPLRFLSGHKPGGREGLNLAKLILVLLAFQIAAGHSDILAQSNKSLPVLGYKNDAQYRIPAQEKYGLDFVEVRKLAEILGSRIYYNNLAQKIVIYLGEHKVKVTAVNPFVAVDDQLYQMPMSTLFDEGGIWVPIKFFAKLIAPYSPIPISYDPLAGHISLILEGTNIHAIAFEEKVNGLLIRIASTKPFKQEEMALRLSEGWMYLDIYGGAVDSSRLAIDKPVGTILKMVPVQFKESAQLSFQLSYGLSQSLEKEDVTVTTSETGILLSLRTSKDIPEDFIVDFTEEREKWLIDKIIIDPGHGGKDPGSLGYGNLREKDIVLDIAIRLKRLLQPLNVEVLMTREKDEFIGLRERSAFANRNGGKLFIGIHANSHPSRRASGMETYILGTARTEADREIAASENSVVRFEDSWAPYGDLSSENSILARMAQSSFEQESQELAATVQSHARRDLGTKDRGIKQAGFVVLIGTSMPKIYVEVGFISNRQEARKLRTKKYRQQIAEAIFKGVKEFKENSESVIYGDETH